MKQISLLLAAVLLLVITQVSVVASAFPMQSGYIQQQSATQQVYSNNITLPQDTVVNSVAPAPAVQPVDEGVSVAAPVVSAAAVQPQYLPAPQPSVRNNQSPVVPGPTLSIPSISVFTNVSYGSIKNPGVLDNQMLHRPVVESYFAADACTDGQNTYITGHSEPATTSTSDFAGVRAFDRLTELQPGDRIYLTGQNGKSCIYQVTHWETAVTNDANQVSASVFQNLYSPQTNGRSMLSIQTCQKGSAHVRLIVRAELVKFL